MTWIYRDMKWGGVERASGQDTLYKILSWEGSTLSEEWEQAKDTGAGYHKAGREEGLVGKGSVARGKMKRRRWIQLLFTTWGHLRSGNEGSKVSSMIPSFQMLKGPPKSAWYAPNLWSTGNVCPTYGQESWKCSNTVPLVACLWKSVCTFMCAQVPMYMQCVFKVWRSGNGSSHVWVVFE